MYGYVPTYVFVLISSNIVNMLTLYLMTGLDHIVNTIQRVVQILAGLTYICTSGAFCFTFIFVLE